METKLSVTEGSRNFSDLVNRIVYRGETAVLTRGGRDVARLIPVRPLSTTGQELAKKIHSRRKRLNADEAQSLHDDLKKMRALGNRPDERDAWAQ